MENTMDKESFITILKDWEITVKDPEDCAHTYFKSTQLRNWTDILHEAKEIYNEVFAEPVEEFSPVEALLAGVAAQASDGTWLTIASALGWDAKILALALAGWQEKDENGEYDNTVLTLEELKALYEKELAFWSALNGDR